MKSNKSHARLDELSRHKKAKKIISVLNTFADLSKCRVLDIGTGSGHIIQDISQICKSATSVDLYDERQAKSKYKFKKVSDEHLPFANNSFDVVITNHVIEHVRNQKLHLSEIYRILKKKGVVYLATPNKYWIADPHYKLPFISWMPRKLASFYLKIMMNKSWDIYPLSYGDVRRLTKKFEVNYLTPEIIKNLAKYELDVSEKLQTVIKFMPLPIKLVAPTHIFILIKK